MTEFKALADDNFNATQNNKYVFYMTANIVEKGGNVGYQLFVLFQECKKKTFILT